MNLKTPKGLTVLVVFMFGFGFMLVPLYDVFCEITGLNGKTNGQYQGEITPAGSEKGRQVTLQFVVNKNDNLPWEFEPNQTEMTLAVGERRETTYRVTNTYKTAAIAQAVPSVSPAEAAEYLNKIECFCFEQQQLVEGEALDMPLRFIVDSELPADVTTLTLSYTLFNISQEALAVAR